MCVLLRQCFHLLSNDELFHCGTGTGKGVTKGSGTGSPPLWFESEINALAVIERKPPCTINAQIPTIAEVPTDVSGESL